MRTKLGRVALAVGLIAGTVAIARVGLSGQEPRTGQPARPQGQINTMPAMPELEWPTPEAGKAYASIDGKRMKGHVEELAAISRKYRDAGHQWWGRLVGASSGVETQQWAEAHLRQAGLEVKVEPYDLAPQVLPKSWSVNVSGAGKSLNLTSAHPWISFVRSAPSPQGDLQLDTVWVGLGMASDFMGKDVKDKAVFIYSIPTPSSLIQSQGWMGGTERAQKGGAKAIFIVLAIPGNMSHVSHLGGVSNDSKLPIFTVGLKDGEAVESLHAAIASGQKLTTNIKWDTETLPAKTAANVVGVLPGTTDENIIMIAHTDGYFEGANDDGAGTAALVGTAEYFAKIPKQQRRRNMYFIATPDHHGGDAGGRWIHDKMQPVLAKTAVILNAEHVAVFEPVWDRPWATPGAPTLIRTNQIGASWWGVNGSDRLVEIIRSGFALFGVPTQINEGGSAGELRAVQFDAPSFYLHNKGIYYHASADTVDVIPATGLRTAVQAFAKIFDDVNKHELKDLRPATSTSTAQPRQ